MNSHHIVKTWVRRCYGSVWNVWFWPWFRPAPCWGANNAPPEPIAGFTGSYFWLNRPTSCLLLKITSFSHSGKLRGIVTTKAYNIPKASSWVQNCTNLVTFFSEKLLKIVATRCHILRQKCTKFDFGRGSAPDPAGGAYSAPTDPLAGIEGAYF